MLTDLPLEQRPREKLVHQGVQALSEPELLAVIIGAGIHGSDAMQTAEDLLLRCGDLPGLHGCPLTVLTQGRGVAMATGCKIKAALELGRRLVEVPPNRGQSFTSSRSIYEQYRGRFSGATQEAFLVVALDAGHHRITERVVALGSADRCPVHPRDVFRPLIEVNAVACVLVHNHPSTGDPRPSEQDLQLTARLRQAADLLHFRLLDHIIIGRGGYCSLLDLGLLAPCAPS